VYHGAMKRMLARVVLSLGLLGAAACGASGAPADGEASALAGKKPGDAYTAYVSAIGNAVAINELHPYLSQGARKAMTSDLESVKARVPAGVLKFKDAKIEGDHATLHVEASINKGGKEVPAEGTVEMVREGGVWKVDKETWTPK
jgi:hypothetical protein